MDGTKVRVTYITKSEVLNGTRSRELDGESYIYIVQW